MTGFVVPRCECGHTQGRHLSGGTALNRASQGGLCMERDCGCRGFREVKPDESPKRDAAWLTCCAERIAEHERAALDGLV